jgi:carbonic anhydrase/acetyltransferase-like protein (isoleucine patch superfamily)
VTLHGCRIGNRCLIGMGAIILNNVEVGEGSIIAAGTVVPENTIIPPGSVVMGIPGVVRRKTTEKDLKRIDQGIEAYLDAMKINLSERRGCVNPVRGFATGAD